MKCVFLGDKVPNSFEEQIAFFSEMPYTIRIKHFQAEDVVPMHYADSIEILLCDGLYGEILIDASRYSLGGRQLFVIPPYTVHSNNIRPGKGTMHVFKISLREMKQYVHIENYLQACGCRIGQLLYQNPACGEVAEIIEYLIQNDGNMPLCIPKILELFRILSQYTDVRRDTNPRSQFRGTSLQDIINWTNENYARRITIEEVANMAGYSKYYFCSHFKAITGMTYMNFLNSVRISHACLMLCNGDSVQTVCRNTGFENTSHFIQMFKRIQHITPHQYANQQRELRNRERRLEGD